MMSGNLIGLTLAVAFAIWATVVYYRSRRCTHPEGHDWLPDGFADWKCSRCNKYR